MTGRSCRNLTVILQSRSQPSGRNGTFNMFSHCSAALSAKSEVSSGKRRLTTRTPCSTNDPRLRDITNPFMSLMTSSCSGCMRSERYSWDACTTSSLIAHARRGNRRNSTYIYGKPYRQSFLILPLCSNYVNLFINQA